MFSDVPQINPPINDTTSHHSDQSTCPSTPPPPHSSRHAQISGACVISGLYCEGALVLANIGDCQAVYHGQVKSVPGTAVTAQTVRYYNGTPPHPPPLPPNTALCGGAYIDALLGFV